MDAPPPSIPDTAGRQRGRGRSRGADASPGLIWLLGTLFIGECNINLVMVDLGLAETHRDPGPRDPYQAEYKAAEATARRQAPYVDPGRSVREPTRLSPAHQAQPVDQRLRRQPPCAPPAVEHSLIGSFLGQCRLSYVVVHGATSRCKPRRSPALFIPFVRDLYAYESLWSCRQELSIRLSEAVPAHVRS
jgi:hypothetical protein